MKARNKILADIVSALGGSVTDANNRNKLIADIVIAAGGTVTDINDRNQLLQDWLSSINVNYVAQLDGATQYWQLSEPVNLVGDFEIQMECYLANTGDNAIFSSDPDINGLGARYNLPIGTLILMKYGQAGGYSSRELSTSSIEGGGNAALRLVRFVRIGNTLTIHADGGERSKTDIDISDTQQITRIGRQGSLYSDSYFKNIKIYTGGDKDTGVLAHEIPLTNKAQGATQLATVGDVNAFMPNFTTAVWRKP